MSLQLNKKERTLYNKWSKQEVYVAFVSEYKRRVAAEEENKRLGREIAALEYKLKHENS